MKTKKQIVGSRGEEEACNWLVGQGHRILRRNWRASHLELDIITIRERTIHIVEVKTRSGNTPVAPESKVDHLKRQRMVRAAGAFMNCPLRGTLPADVEVQFDVLTVVFEEPEPRIQYFPQAFIPMYF